MEQHFDVAIVGTGHGGAQAAIALRAQGYAGSVALIGEERELPYERPPLSKEYLAGERDFERLLIRPASFWTDRDIAFLSGRRIVGVDPAAHRVDTAEGETIGYRTLIWAAGGSPRRLACPGANLRGIHYVRCRDDADGMMAALPKVKRAAVIGGGYIGLEAAAVLRKLGKDVVLIEALDRVLARVAGEQLSRHIEDAHRAQGVELRLGSGVAEILGAGGAVTGVRLSNGETIAADMIVVGIGIVPEVAPLLEAGAEGGNGVLVDAQCRTSLPDSFAVGDCALHANGFADGASVRLESVQNATDQALVAAKTIAGHPTAYDAVPWFWSNQYDLKLQTVGLSAGHDRTVVRRNAATGGLSIVYLRSGRVIALDCVNMTRDYVQGRTLVAGRLAVPADRLADADTPLKDLAKEFG